MAALRGLYAVKPWFVRRLAPAVGWLTVRRVHPDVLSALAIPLAGAGSLCVWLGADWRVLWLVPPVLGVARLAANALDGAVARASGLGGGPAGALRNELADRAADLAMLAGYAAFASPVLLAWCVASMLACSMSGVLGLALTGSRLTAGPMGKADRVAVLALAPAVAFFAGPGALRVAVWVVGVGAAATALRRFVFLWRETSAAPR